LNPKSVSGSIYLLITGFFSFGIFKYKILLEAPKRQQLRHEPPYTKGITKCPGIAFSGHN
jgi:hypothetical protein